jgi:predicted branched-subunit amino acid permease
MSPGYFVFKVNPLVSMSVGVGLATGLYGISFGALSTAAGLDVWQTQVLSLLMFSGGSQFAFIGVIAAGGPAAVGAAVVSAWLLGVRNGFYAVRMNPILSAIGFKRLVAAQLTIDESTAVATAQDLEGDQRRGFWLTGAAVFLFWNSMTLIGALLGNALGDPKAWGLDAAAAAAFLALLWPRLKERQALAVGALAFLIAVITTPSLPAGVPIILAGGVAVIVGGFNIFEAKSKSAGGPRNEDN